MYYLYSGRLNGWLSRGGNYSTDLADAAVHTREDALAICRRHKNQGGYQLLPVAQADLEKI